MDNTNIINRGGCHPIILASRCGHELVLNTLLELGYYEINVLDDKGRNALHNAYMCSQDKIVTLLKSTTIDKHAFDDQGMMPYALSYLGINCENYCNKILSGELNPWDGDDYDNLMAYQM